MRGAQLAEYYQSIFQNHKPGDRPDEACTRQNTSIVAFELNADIRSRFIATYRTIAAKEFRGQWITMREASDAEWQELEDEIQSSVRHARKQHRQQDNAPLDYWISRIQTELKIEIQGNEEDKLALAQDFNVARIAFLDDCMAVIEGKKSVNALSPEPETQLPLLELWGDAAEQTVETWRSVRVASRGEVNVKSYQKYRSVAVDLGQVLTRRPVQALTSTDLKGLLRLWKSAGNEPPTIKTKLGILKTLLRPFDSDRRLRSLVDDIPLEPRKRAARIPFTDDQLSTFFSHVISWHRTRKDDKMLLMLMVLLASRIEEIYQLSDADFERTDYGWLVRFVDARQSGSGQTQLKTAESARRTPIYSKQFLELDQWLCERITSGGYLFPDGSDNQYGIRSSSASRRLNRQLRKLFPSDRRLVLQSTRNSAAVVMRRAGTDPRIRRRYLGHADHRIHEQHYEPGELLDEKDLETGATAIAEYLYGLLDECNVAPALG